MREQGFPFYTVTRASPILYGKTFMKKTSGSKANRSFIPAPPEILTQPAGYQKK
jgi:hypothetical protein